MTIRHALRDRDAQWERSKDMLPGKPGDVGVTAKDNRMFVDIVLYRYIARVPRRGLHERFGDFNVVHTRLIHWSKKNDWDSGLCEASDNEY